MVVFAGSTFIVQHGSRQEIDDGQTEGWCHLEQRRIVSL